MNKGFTVASQMMRASSTADGGMSVGFHTKELTTEEKALIMGFHMNQGWLLFQPNEIAETDVPTTSAEKDAKTPSQRLRAVLFILWKQSGDLDDFERYYQQKMESLINSIKMKLDTT